MWDDPAVRWDSFSHVVVSSTWVRVDRRGEYLAWAQHVATEADLVNSAAVLGWGLDKQHQRQLAAAGVLVVPTTWLAPGEPWSVPETEFVIKPTVSAGGRNTARYFGGDAGAVPHGACAAAGRAD